MAGNEQQKLEMLAFIKELYPKDLRSYTNNITLLQLPRSSLEIWAEEVVNKKDFLVLDSSGLLLTVLTLQYKQNRYALLIQHLAV